MRAEDTPPAQPEPRGLQPPCRAQAPGDGTRQEPPQGLAPPGRGRIMGGGHANMVSPVVLHIEVSVPRRRQGDPRQPPLHGFPLVAEFVRGVDGDAVDDAQARHETEPRSEPQVCADPHHRTEDQSRVLQRHVGVGDPAVERHLLQPCRDRFRWIDAVITHPGVDDRDEPEDEQRRQPPTPPGARGEPSGQPGEGQDGYHKGQQPPWLLGITPHGLHSDTVHRYALLDKDGRTAGRVPGGSRAV